MKDFYQKAIRKYLSAVNKSHLIVFFAFLLVMAYGTIGTYCLRDHFKGIYSFKESFFYTVTVFSTLGDNIITPITIVARSFVVSMVFLGFSVFGMFFTLVVYEVVDNLNQIFNKIEGGKVHIKDHVVICGYSMLTEQLINQLLKSHTRFLLIDNGNHPELNPKEGGNYLYAKVPNKKDNLISTNIEFCKAFIAVSDSDSENILAAITASSLKKQYNAQFKIVVRVLSEDNIEVAQNSGATDVISPTLMAAKAIMQLI